MNTWRIFLMVVVFAAITVASMYLKSHGHVTAEAFAISGRWALGIGVALILGFTWAMESNSEEEWEWGRTIGYGVAAAGLVIVPWFGTIWTSIALILAVGAALASLTYEQAACEDTPSTTGVQVFWAFYVSWNTCALSSLLYLYTGWWLTAIGLVIFGLAIGSVAAVRTWSRPAPRTSTRS